MRNTLFNGIIAVVLLCLLAVAFRLEAVVITSGSMEKTLVVGDHVLVEKLSSASSSPLAKIFMRDTDLANGEIVMFRSPTETGQTFIKRIVGVPGDHLRMMARVLYRNGHRVVEPYTSHIFDPSSTAWNASLDNFPASVSARDPLEIAHSEIFRTHVTNGEIVVPPRSYFVMGDNRDDSYDSRDWGFVSRDNIIGKPVLIYWSQRKSHLGHMFRLHCAPSTDNMRLCFTK